MNVPSSRPGGPPATLPFRPLRVRLPTCLRKSERFRLPDGREATLMHILTTTLHWERCPESVDRRWRTLRFGFLMIAYRIVL